MSNKVTTSEVASWVEQEWWQIHKERHILIQLSHNSPETRIIWRILSNRQTCIWHQFIGISSSNWSTHRESSVCHNLLTVIWCRVLFTTRRGTRHYYKTHCNPAHQRGLNPCWTRDSRSMPSWSCLDSKLADLTHFSGSRALHAVKFGCFLSRNLPWGEEVHPQKCWGTVSCACFFAIRNSLTHRLTNPFLHLTWDPNPDRKWPKAFSPPPPSCWLRIYMVFGGWCPMVTTKGQKKINFSFTYRYR